jgi:hypothetical protein
MMRLSPFFDGDLVLVKRIYLSIYSFLRKFNLVKKGDDITKEDLTAEDNVDGVLIEPLSSFDLGRPKYNIEHKTEHLILDEGDDHDF